MSAPGGYVPNVIIFVPVRFIPPDTRAQATIERYIAVPAGTALDQLEGIARDRLGGILAGLRQNRYRPFAGVSEYRVEILPITAIPRESETTRGY